MVVKDACELNGQMLDKNVIYQRAPLCVKGWGCYYRKYHPDGVVFTYILKDANSDCYKIGRTSNLKNRIRVVRNSVYFDRLDYYLIAFTPCDIEKYVQDTVIKAGGVPVKKRSQCGVIPKEMFVLDEDSINAIIDAFLFHRTENGMIPVVKELPEGKNRGLFCQYDVISWVAPPTKRYNKKEDA